MSDTEATQPGNRPEPEPRRSRSLLKAGAAAFVIGLLALVGVSVAGVDDVIDLPGWANVRGVDVPLIGDTDAIDCRLRQVVGTRDVEITLVDGDEDTYPLYVHVWNNGGIVDPELVSRPRADVIITPSTEGTDMQYYSVSINPVEEERVFCESLLLVS